MAKGVIGRSKEDVAENIARSKINDLTKIEEIMERTKSQIQETYNSGSEATKFLAEAARNQLIRDSLEIAQKALDKIKHEKLVMGTIKELASTFKCMVQMANLLTERFKEDEGKRTSEMTDEELEKEAEQTKVN